MKTIKLKSNIVNDDYTNYVYESYDIQNKEYTTNDIDYDLSNLDSFDWNIGVIYGGSGSGKTSILKELGDVSDFKFDNSKALISNFDWLSPEDASRLLTSMGLSSVPTWLRPFNILSNGEQYRAMLAYKVGKAKVGDIILIDEYTSVVNRDVAKSMSYALQKYVRRVGKKVILASCHYDIMEWLMPDWTCSPQNGGRLEKADYLRNGKPKIELQVGRVESDTWNIFKKHHYMSEDVNKAYAQLLFTWNDNPVGICVYKPQPNHYVKEDTYALSRTVVLPDFQGMGIGSFISDFTSAILKNDGKRVYTKTVNPALGIYRENSDKWRGTGHNGKIRTDIDNELAKSTKKSYKTHLDRKSYCHEYIGDSIDGYGDLLLSIDEMRFLKRKKMFSNRFW